MEIKSGFRTSEFWLSLAAAALPIVARALGIEISSEEALGIMGLAGIFAGSRSYAKGKSAQATIVTGPDTPVYGVKPDGTIEPAQLTDAPDPAKVAGK